MSHTVLDLFSAAAGGWSLGMHRAGFTTVAACEVEEWRRIIYSENNPGVRLYNDVRILRGEHLLRDLGALPDIIVGSPPCQDISSANAKGKGVDGERSGLFFEAIRIVGECRPRWVALENSARLRTKGADRVIGQLEGLGYTCWPAVVRAEDVGANHERPRVWLIAFDADQIVEGAISGVLGKASANSEGGVASDADGHGWPAGRGRRRLGLDLPISRDLEYAPGVGHESGGARRRGADGLCTSSAARRASADAGGAGHEIRQGQRGNLESSAGSSAERDAGARACSHPDGQSEPDSAEHDEMGRRSSLGADAAGPWAEWNGGLAHHLRVDDGLSAWVAQSRIAVGGPRGTAAASLLVEAFGDAVVPQITESIGRAILRVEASLTAIYGRAAA